MFVRYNSVYQLASEMVSQMPNELFESSVTTFADPDMASGSYLLAIKNRLELFGHDKYNIESRLFGFCSSRIKQNNIKKKFGFTPIFIQENFLETHMKFDAVIGNPPYQDSNKSENVKGGGGKGNLYPKFVEKTWEVLKPTGVCTLIVPTNYFSTTQWGQASKKNETFLKKNVLCIKTGVESYFSVGTNISYFIAKNQPFVKSPIVNENLDFVYSDMKLIPTDISTIALSILNKLTSKNGYKYAFIREKMPIGNSICFISMQGARVSSTGYLKFHDDLHGTGQSGLLYHSCENSEKFKQILHHPCFRFFMIMTKNSGVVYPGIMNAMTMPPENINIDILYDWYELTKEEIDYIEKKFLNSMEFDITTESVYI